MLSKEIVLGLLRGDLTDEQVKALSDADMQQLEIFAEATAMWRQEQNDVLEGALNMLEQALPTETNDD